MCSDDLNDCLECALCIACCYACCLCCCKDKNNSSVGNQPSPAIISQPHTYGGGGGGGGTFLPQDPYAQHNNPYGYQQQVKDANAYGGGFNPNAMMGGGGQYPGQYANNPYPPQQGFPPQGAPPPYPFHQGPPAPGSYFPPQSSDASFYPPNAPPPPMYPQAHNLPPEQGKY